MNISQLFTRLGSLLDVLVSLPDLLIERLLVVAQLFVLTQQSALQVIIGLWVVLVVASSCSQIVLSLSGTTPISNYR